MKRGTTVDLTFRLSEDLNFDAFYITFKQGDKVILEKTEKDCVKEGKVIVVSLTQQDTLAMKAGTPDPVRVQLRGVVGDRAYATDIKNLYAGEILKEGVIPNEGD